MLEWFVTFIWWILGLIGIYKDLPPVPDAKQASDAVSPKKISTPVSKKDLHVSFSPVKDYIPNYGFDKSSPDEPEPEQIQIEADNYKQVKNEELLQLQSILEELTEELEDAEKEHLRLLKENAILKEKEIIDSKKSQNE